MPPCSAFHLTALDSCFLPAPEYAFLSSVLVRCETNVICVDRTTPTAYIHRLPIVEIRVFTRRIGQRYSGRRIEECDCLKRSSNVSQAAFSRMMGVSMDALQNRTGQASAGRLRAGTSSP